MSLHPFERFLGVPENATPQMLLGLRTPDYDLQMIDETLRRRLAVIFRHPDGRSDDAEIVRTALREAAEHLKREMRQIRLAAHAEQTAIQPEWMTKAVRSKSRPRLPGPTPFKLTAFDRLVLSVLVACGGWNARSRAQLVALAQKYGVSVQGLLRVMQGLSAYARAGGPRIGVTDIASKEMGLPFTQLALAAPPPVGAALLDRLAEDFGRELKRGGAWPTIRLAIIFGVLTIIMGIVALRTVFRSDAPAGNSTAEVANPNGIDDAARVASTKANVAAAPAGGVVGIARFATPPTFLGNGLPAEAVNAVDHLPALPGQLDELARKITVADGAPSDAVYKQWTADIDSIAMSWAIGDASTRKSIDKTIFEALRAAADTPAVSDALLKALVPPVSISKPLDLWRGTWMAGQLASIASSANLPPVVVDRARSHLEIALSQNLRGSMTPEAAGSAWLAQRVTQLVQMLPFDDKAYDSWELWLTAERALGDGERHDAAIVLALRAILETDYDLSLPGPAVNVTARLLGIALHANSAVSRQRLLDLFDDEAIIGRDLWVLTSLIASAENDAAWFPDRLVVPEDTDMALRWRVRDDLAKAWPAPSLAASEPDANATRPKLDPMESERWFALANRILGGSVGSDQTLLMQQIIDASRLTEAAVALANDSPAEASRIMQQVDDGWIMGIDPRSTPSTPPAKGGVKPATPPRPGQSIGNDGVWAAKYAELGKNAEARSESLRALRTNAGTDLGPIDATLLVREAYRGSPQDVRDVAQAVLGQQFKSGPIVAMQLLDQFPDAPASEPISDLIQSVTNKLLPGVRSSAWPAEARLALVHHALDLRDFGGAPIDELIEPLIDTYASRVIQARKDATVTSTPLSPQEAAEALLRALTAQAEFAAPSEPTPADLPNLQRRHNTRLALADGPIQAFVAQQLAILDVTIYSTVAEQPALRERVLEIMREHAAARAHLASALEQALDVERAVLDVWRLRLGFDPKLQEPQEQPEGATP